MSSFPTVPIVASLDAIYPPPTLSNQRHRWNSLTNAFTTTFGNAPTLISRSPGRVNLIGEHVDYSLYSVLPSAITHDALLAVRTTPSTDPDGGFTVSLHNTSSEFPSRTFTVPKGPVPVDATKPDWSNYFRAGLRGALEHLSVSKTALVPLDLQILVDGNVPVGGGLSSSAAFVTATLLATLYAHTGVAPTKSDLTNLAIVSERAVGVNSGGMDQSASVFSQASSVLHVRFVPELSATPIAIPSTDRGLVVLIANSGVTSNKRLTAPVQYNLRVVECTIAAAVLCKVVNGGELPKDAGPLGGSLHGFHDVYVEKEACFAAKGEEEQLQELYETVEKTLLKEGGYTREEIAELLGVSVADVEKRYLSAFPVEASHFKLRQRALHVFSEAARVLQFIKLLADPPAGGDALPAALGALMNKSQESCRELYECSHEALDAICEIARRHGAWGSRLTGAGWGGCSVHLVPHDRVEEVTKGLETEYFGKRGVDTKGMIVVTDPAGGSAIVDIKAGVPGF